MIDWTVTHWKTLSSLSAVKKNLQYRILETQKDPLSQQTWHKLSVQYHLWHMILHRDCNLRNRNWDIIQEIDGTNWIWVTDQYLTLLQIQGAVHDATV